MTVGNEYVVNISFKTILCCLLCQVFFVCLFALFPYHEIPVKKQVNKVELRRNRGDRIISSGDSGVNRKQLICTSLADSSSNVYDCIPKNKQKRVYLVLLEIKKA